MRDTVAAYLGLGANLGNAEAALGRAIACIAVLPGSSLVRCSSLYRSAAVDASGPDYLNAVIEVATTLSPVELLVHLQRLEQAAGRERPYRNAPRTLDLDILLYGDQRIATAALCIPHPRMHARAFVLVPLAEIAPHLVQAAQLNAVASQVIVRLPGAAGPGADAAGGMEPRR